MLAGGANVVAQAGGDGIILIDTGAEGAADKLVGTLPSLIQPQDPHLKSHRCLRQAGYTFTGHAERSHDHLHGSGPNIMAGRRR